MNRQEYEREFTNIVSDLIKLTMAKNNDYASDEDVFSNFRAIEHMTGGRITAAQGIVTRMSDKLSRIANLVSGKVSAVGEEGINDTARDLAVYSLILILLRVDEARKRIPTAGEPPSVMEKPRW